jgi:hypothetical protein
MYSRNVGAHPEGKAPQTFNILFVESNKGLWDGGEGWVRTWGEAVQFKGGAACLAAAKTAECRTGLKCWVACGQAPSGYAPRFVDTRLGE